MSLNTTSSTPMIRDEVQSTGKWRMIDGAMCKSLHFSLSFKVYLKQWLLTGVARTSKWCEV